MIPTRSMWPNGRAQAGNPACSAPPALAAGAKNAIVFSGVYVTAPTLRPVAGRPFVGSRRRTAPRPALAFAVVLAGAVPMASPAIGADDTFTLSASQAFQFDRRELSVGHSDEVEIAVAGAVFAESCGADDIESDDAIG